VSKARDPITRLRTAIDCLPVRTRRAMLDGIRANEIVVGAYTDGHGGICPMLAAHRRGGRTSFLSFARAWDAFARSDRVRRATARELRTLEDLLTASLDEEAPATDLAAAIAEHRAARRAARSGDGAEPVDEPEQVQRRERLGQEEVGAGGAGVALGVVVGVAGEHDDRRVGGAGLGAQAPAGLDAVQARHVDVQEDDRRLGVAGALDGLFTVSRLGHPVARDVLEGGGDEPPYAGVVVDDEDRAVHESPSRKRANVSSGIVS